MKKANRALAKRILDKIEELFLVNSIPHTAKSIIGEHGVFRVRTGEYRAIYRINYEANTIIILKIDKRSRIYIL